MMEGLGSLLFFAILFFLVMRFGCGAHTSHGNHGRQKAKKYIDPVCDKAVETEQGYGKMHDGVLFRFCSKICLEKFDADPERYLNHTRGEGHDV